MLAENEFSTVQALLENTIRSTAKDIAVVRVCRAFYLAYRALRTYACQELSVLRPHIFSMQKKGVAIMGSIYATR
jgi:hypothetical protein